MNLARCGCDDEGQVTDVDLVLVPEQQRIDFGEVWQGADATDVVRLTNLGDATLRFNDVAIADTAGPFTLLSPPPSTLAPDQVLTLTVRFAPTALGVHEGALVVRSDAENAPTLSISLFGTGVAAPLCDDENVCTDDTFDLVLGACVYAARAGSCDDGSACTTLDVCFEGACLGQGITCDDDDPCTIDVCDATIGCVALPDESVCDDENPCTDDFCLEGGACASVAKPDNTVCSEVFSCAGIGLCQNGTCVDFAVPDGTPCSDGDVCTVDDACAGGVCSPGAASSEPPGVTSVVPFFLPTTYSPLLSGSARRFGDRVVQVAPGFAAVFNFATPESVTLLASHPLVGGYRGESVGMFDDGRAVVLLSHEGRVLVLDPSLGDDALVAELTLPDGSAIVDESLGMVSAGDRVFFLHGGSLFVLTSDLVVTPLVEFPEGFDGIDGTASHLFVFHRSPMMGGASTRIFDATGPVVVERAELPYSCRGVALEGDRAACVTLRELDGVVAPRIAVLDVPSIDLGSPITLVEISTEFQVPVSGAILVGGDLVLRDHLGSSIVRVDPLTGTVRESFGIVGRTLTAIDAQTLLTTEGELVVADPTTPVGESFTRLLRGDLGAVAGAQPGANIVVDGDAAWLISRGGIGRIALENGAVTSTDVAASPLEAADGYRAAMLVRLPTSDTTTVVTQMLGGPTTAGFLPVDVTQGPLGIETARFPVVIESQLYQTAGSIGLGFGTSLGTSWPVVSLSPLFSPSVSLPLVSTLPLGPYVDDSSGGIPQRGATLSQDGRRILIGARAGPMPFGVPPPTRFVVVDMSVPTNPTVGGAAISALALPPAPSSSILDYVPGPDEPSEPFVESGVMRTHGSTFTGLSTNGDGVYHVLAIDADDALAPSFVARGWVELPPYVSGPGATSLLFVTESGRAFFGRGPFGPSPSVVVSVVPGVTNGESVVLVTPEESIEVPSYPTTGALVGDTLVVIGDGWLATISPPCD